MGTITGPKTGLITSIPEVTFPPSKLGALNGARAKALTPAGIVVVELNIVSGMVIIKDSPIGIEPV